MRWGHSMVQHAARLLVFGGYGGADAHKRLGDLVAVDTTTGAARLLDPSGNPGQPSCNCLWKALAPCTATLEARWKGTTGIFYRHQRIFTSQME